MERHQINQLKSISIECYLQTLGIEVAKANGQKLYYHSPFRSDSTPSFVVNLDSNTFKDFAESDKPEDIIRLVQRLHNLSFKDACQHLSNWTNTVPPKSFLSIGKEVLTNGKGSIQVIETKPLETPYLLDYVKTRKINAALSYLYLSEIIYENRGKRYKGIGFKNVSGGYEIRDSQGRKYSTSPKDITYFPKTGSKTVSVFEGFFDFLSALMYHKITAPKHSVAVLNSTSNIAKSLPTLSVYGAIYSYLDYDNAGQKALTKLQNHGLNIIDASPLYSGYKDFSEFWQVIGND